MAGKPKRPMPAGFLQVAASMTVQEAGRHFKSGDLQIKRWFEEAGAPRVGNNAHKTLPADIETLAAGHSLSSLAAVIGWTDCTVARQLKRHNPAIYEALRANGRRISIAPPLAPKMKPAPSDFLALCRTKSQSALARHCGVGAKVVVRWLREAGPEAQALASAAGVLAKSENGRIQGALVARRQRKAKTVATAVCARSRKMPAVFLPAATDGSKFDLARDYLRRFGACYSAKFSDKPAMGGYFFKGLHYTADALAAEAIKRGWQPNAWKELAA